MTLMDALMTALMAILLLATLDDLFEFTSVEPNATALRVIINFDALAGRSVYLAAK